MYIYLYSISLFFSLFSVSLAYTHRIYFAYLEMIAGLESTVGVQTFPCDTEEPSTTYGLLENMRRPASSTTFAFSFLYVHKVTWAQGKQARVPMTYRSVSNWRQFIVKMTMYIMLINLKEFRRLKHIEVKWLESVSKAPVIQRIQKKLIWQTAEEEQIVLKSHRDAAS